MTVRLTRIKIHCPACEVPAEGAWYRPGRLVGGMQAYPGEPVVIKLMSCNCGKVNCLEALELEKGQA
jgi:hypothetical protein